VKIKSRFKCSYVETDSALGTALNAAYQLLKPTGGRITVMQTCLPNVGEGALKTRDEFIVEKVEKNHNIIYLFKHAIKLFLKNKN
jgi:hypothetical protein